MSRWYTISLKSNKRSCLVVFEWPKRFLIPIWVASMAFLLQVGNCGIIDFDFPEIVDYGTCPQPNIEELDMERFSGIWYQVQEVPNQYVEVRKCIRTKYIYNGTSLLVTTEGLDMYGDLTDQNAVLTPVLSLKSSQTPYLSLRSPNVPPVTYHILKANYSEFACAYSCFEVIDMKVEVYTILTRIPNPKEESLTTCHRSFQDLHLSLGKLQPVIHESDCWYNNDDSPQNIDDVEIHSTDLSEDGDTDDRQEKEESNEEILKDSPSKDSSPRLEEDEDRGDSGNVLLSILTQIDDNNAEDSLHKPFDGYKKILVGEDTIVSLNITKLSLSSSSVKKTDADGTQENTEERINNEEEKIKKLQDTASSISPQKEEIMEECYNDYCHGNGTPSSSTVWQFRHSMMTFCMAIICLTF